MFKSFRESQFFRNVLLFLAVMGPGIITASVGNNSAGIATYSLAGGHFGYSLLWSFIPMTIFLILAQEMSARMAIATGKGLADLIREHFGVKITFYLMLTLFGVNLICIMAEFSGVAASLEILNISKYVSVPAAALLVWLLIVKGSYKFVERIFLVLSLLYFSYIVSGFMAKPQWDQVLKQSFIIPKGINLDYLIMLVGLLGTTITPWMQFYLQSSIVEKRVSIENYQHVKLDVIVGCILSNLVAIFIVVACAATLFQSGVEVHSVKDAALALKPLAGPYAMGLFAFGLFNAAIFAVCILPLSTAYSICEGMGWEEGVDKRFEEAPQFFGLYTAMIILGAGTVLLPNFPLLKIMYFSQVANGVLLPAILIIMFLLINNKDLMGSFVNTKSSNILTFFCILIIIILNLGVVAFSLMPR